MIQEILQYLGLELLTESSTIIDLFNLIIELFFGSWLFFMLLKGLFGVMKSIGKGF